MAGMAMPFKALTDLSALPASTRSIMPAASMVRVTSVLQPSERRAEANFNLRWSIISLYCIYNLIQVALMLFSNLKLATMTDARPYGLIEEGVTTIEIKSGYGLDIDTELKMLRTARRLGTLYPVDIVTSYLGAHAFPPEYRENHAGYVNLVCNDALPAVAGEKLSDAVDGFC